MLKSKLDEDLKAAMLDGDKRLVSILRGMKSAILYKEVADGRREEGLADDDVITVLKKEQKSRKEAKDMYSGAGETERADEEQYQLEVIQGYLPEEMSEEDVIKLVDDVISQIDGEISMKDMGRVIGSVKSKASNADGALIAKIVKEKIS